MERGGEGKEERQYPQLCLLPEPSVQGCPALKDCPNPFLYSSSPHFPAILPKNLRIIVNS